MEIILLTDIAGVGYKNDIVTVKPGFGRNYLIPQGFAVLASKTNRKVVEENIRQAAHKAEKLKKDAEDLATAIGETILTIPAAAGDSGRIFGRITTTQISDALRAKGFEIDRKKITVDEIKTLGNHSALIDLHKEVKHKVALEIVAI
ncbi:50S ribosomal protein L9 [Ravibacter arvi]|uniref:Large ribosomal subunit protein bL9 n=1 Tax=Ravibacter arvi TaxID=2051041 RepID=A0ABP8MC75_9BACT